MASINKVIIIGNIGRDPEVRYTPSGSAVCNLSLATTRSWKNKDSGEKNEETEWHRVVMYDRLAEVAGEYLKKGASCYIEGRLKTRKWADKDGAEKYTTEVIAEEMKMLGRTEVSAEEMKRLGGNGERDAGGGGAQRERPAPKQQRAADPGAYKPQPKQATGTGFDSMDDDIPF